MHILFVKKLIEYTGEQLSPHWAYTNFNLTGDSIVSFIGPCDVKPRFMIDLEDLKEGSRIYSTKMLHFIIEHFDTDIDIEKAVLRQHLLAAIVRDEIEKLSGEKISRIGSDLYHRNRKLSVSVATVSLISSLIHFGINISAKGVPVPARGLSDLRVSPTQLAKRVLSAYSAEIEKVADARARVRTRNS
jgi:hypothetical protein